MWFEDKEIVHEACELILNFYTVSYLTTAQCVASYKQQFIVISYQTFAHKLIICTESIGLLTLCCKLEYIWKFNKSRQNIDIKHR